MPTVLDVAQMLKIIVNPESDTDSTGTSMRVLSDTCHSYLDLTLTYSNTVEVSLHITPEPSKL